MRVSDDRDRRRDALGEDEGAHAEVHLAHYRRQGCSGLAFSGAEELTTDAPQDSHFAKYRGNTGKSTARMHMKVKRSIWAL